jgi:hypothetical protein
MHTIFWLENLKQRSLRSPRHRWKSNIKMDLREIGWEGVNWIHLVQDWDQWQALVDTVTHVRLRWMGHLTHMGQMRIAYSILAEELKGRDHLEDLGIGGKIILEWILGK